APPPALSRPGPRRRRRHTRGPAPPHAARGPSGPTCSGGPLRAAPAPMATEVPPPKCAWLAAEGLRLEARAAELDRAGSATEATFQHQRAAAKLAEAAALCPGDHPDGPTLSAFSAQVSLRAVYLQSLGGGTAGAPLEDHVGEVPSLAMDLSSAEQPAEETVPTLLARGGASGATAPLTEEGYQLVLALGSGEQTKAFVLRVLDAGGRRPRAGAEAQLDAFASGSAPPSLADLREAMQVAGWVELSLDPSKDKMEVAVQLEQEAKALDERGLAEEAAQMYDRSLAVFRFVHKYDPRTKNPKIKDMVGKRIDELVERVNRLKEAASPRDAAT
ncbi:unnamed protein product, partial [Prorocentrum cordatum]